VGRNSKTPAPISPLALEAVRRIDALFEIERSINGHSAEQRRAVIKSQNEFYKKGTDFLP
jgi:transposase